MAVSNALKRLQQIRELEEEQQRLALESALGELRRIEKALRAARERERAGRQRIAASAPSSDPADRVAAIVEMDVGSRDVSLLTRRLAAAEQWAADLRHTYLAKRTEKRQAETVICAAESLAAVERRRRDQQQLDDWHGARRSRLDPQRAAVSSSAQESRPVIERREIKNGQQSELVPEAELKSNP